MPNQAVGRPDGVPAVGEVWCAHDASLSSSPKYWEVRITSYPEVPGENFLQKCGVYLRSLNDAMQRVEGSQELRILLSVLEKKFKRTDVVLR